MKNSFIDVLRYKFDNLMSKGALALVGLLFLATTAVIVVVSVLAILFSGNTFGVYIWESIKHVIDPGTITGTDTADLPFIILMGVVTLCGIFVTSILIGIITTGFEEKLQTLKKGNARIIEKNHTLVLGFNENIYTILSELITANESEKDACIVILTEHDKEETEAEIEKQITDCGTTRIICRSGGISDVHMLRQCSIDTCKSVIINVQDDFLVTKAILAINNHYAEMGETQNRPHIVATVNDTANYEAIKIAGGDYIEPILIKDSIARIIAQTCRQPGLSNVLVELFDYSGNELYFETFPQLSGKTFGEVLNLFEQATLFGYRRQGENYINPDKNVLLKPDDELLLLVEDNGMAKPLETSPKIANLEKIKADLILNDKPENILILGSNILLERILLELDNYFVKGSKIYLADEIIDEYLESIETKLINIDIEFIECDIDSRESLDDLLKKDVDHVLLLSPDDSDAEESDSRTLLKLIHLRDIAQKGKKTFNITSEMKSTTNQKLAHVAKVNDLVVGSNIVNLILTQISENRGLAKVFRELLHADGSEIYLRSASQYVELDCATDFYTVTEIAKNRDEVAIGYKKQRGDLFEIITSPNKSEKITFNKDDYIVVLASD